MKHSSKKQNRIQPQMNNFRFDVILRRGSGSGPQAEAITLLDWEKDGLTLEKFQLLLSSASLPVLHISNVPNARTVKSKKVMELLASADPQEKVEQLKTRIEKELENEPGIQPTVFWDLENEDYRIEVDWDYQQWEGKMLVRCIKKNTGPSSYQVRNFSIVQCSNRPAVSTNESEMQELKNNISQKFAAPLHPEEVFVISSEMYALFNEQHQVG